MQQELAKNGIKTKVALMSFYYKRAMARAMLFRKQKNLFPHNLGTTADIGQMLLLIRWRFWASIVKRKANQLTLCNYGINNLYQMK